jgi:hypothetical protein
MSSCAGRCCSDLLWSVHILANLRNLRPDAQKGDKILPRLLARLKQTHAQADEQDIAQGFRSSPKAKKGRLDDSSLPFVVENAGGDATSRLQPLREVPQWLIWKWATTSEPWR